MYKVVSTPTWANTFHHLTTLTTALVTSVPRYPVDVPSTATMVQRALPEYDYIFAFGLIFAFLDAWNIGANDVANSFATSVSSRSLTMLQAMVIATVVCLALRLYYQYLVKS